MGGTAYIGTSSWQYRHWRGSFYPSDLTEAGWLAYYAGRFDCVELGGPLPAPGTIAAWCAGIPDGFRFAAVAPRRITHLHKLKNCGAALEAFLARVAGFGDRLGPVLFRLPPRWRRNLRRLESFVEALPPDRRYAFEFRDPSWHDEDVYALLSSRSIAFCIYDDEGVASPIVDGADFVYLRLGGERYNAPRLRPWADRIRAWARQSKDVYVILDEPRGDAAAKIGARIIGLLDAA